MANVRSIQAMSGAAVIVVIGYVVGAVIDVDLGSSATFVRIVVLAAAAVVAVIAFQAFSHASGPHTISAMIVGLLGGASLASSITTAAGNELYGSRGMALVGTMAVVAAVAILQVGRTTRTEGTR